MREIVTHDGIFHADELFTVALLLEVIGVVPVRRTRQVTLAELADPEIWVLDQYGQLDWDKHNFDHHHDITSESTNMLVLNYLAANSLIEKELLYLLKEPFIAISDIDRRGLVPFNGFQVNEFFRTLNNIDNGFDISLAIVRTWIRGLKELVKKKEESIRLWKNGRVEADLVKICKEFPIFWKSYEEQPLLVAPDRSGEWRLHSADTNKYPIQSTGRETFLHVNRFIAGYKTKADAIEAALITAKPPLTGGI